MLTILEKGYSGCGAVEYGHIVSFALMSFVERNLEVWPNIDTLLELPYINRTWRRKLPRTNSQNYWSDFGTGRVCRRSNWLTKVEACPLPTSQCLKVADAAYPAVARYFIEPRFGVFLKKIKHCHPTAMPFL